MGTSIKNQRKKIDSDSCRHTGEISCEKPSHQQVEDFLMQADALCLKRKQRFTDLRKQVLSLVCRSEQPLGAYALLDLMKDSGRSAAPPTVYRTLDFLQATLPVHIPSINMKRFFLSVNNVVLLRNCIPMAYTKRWNPEQKK